MLINRNNAAHEKYPESMHGTVLLEELPPGQGYLSADLDTVKQMKSKTQAELVASGWDKYKHIIDSIPENAVVPPRPIKL